MLQFTLNQMLNPEENINIQKIYCNTAQVPHTHEFVEIVYILSGKGKQRINTTEYTVSKGDLLFINYNQTHAFTVEEPMEYVNFLMKPAFMSTELLNSENILEIFSLTLFEEFKDIMETIQPIAHFQGREVIEVEEIIENMLDEFTRKEIGYKTILKGYMEVIISHLLRKMNHSYCQNSIKYVTTITPSLLKYIDDNCFKKLTLSELAEKSFYNPAYFGRMFKEFYGKSLISYIHEKRINEAVRLLTETSLSIEQIYLHVGYTDKKQFYKLFKEYTGSTPNAVRKL